MSWIKFKYSPVVDPAASGGFLLDSDGKMVKRPILWIELTENIGKTKIKVPGIIDSGADTTTVNIQYADILGIELDKKNPRQIRGIGEGTVTKYQGVFPFAIKELDIKLEVPAWFVDSKNVDVLLGRQVFFDVFKIKFEQAQDVFELNQI